MFEYQQQEYKKIIFDASDLIQYDVELNLPLFLNKNIRDIKNIIIVGAWQGDEVRSFLKLPNADIYCFEANPKTFKILKELYKNEDRVHCYNYACSDTDGAANFYETNINGNGSLLELENHPIAKSGESFEVETIKLDSSDELKNKNIDLLWIDVQGAELSVLQGAKDLLVNTSIIFIEVNYHGDSYKGAVKFFEVDAFIKRYDFKIIAQGLDRAGIEGNAIYLKYEPNIFYTDEFKKRIGKILEFKIKKREIYHNRLFKIIHKFMPQKLRTALKKKIHFN